MAGQNVGASIVEISFTRRLDPISGQVAIQQVFEGTESGIYAQAATSSSAGGRTEITQEGGVNRLVVTFSRDPDEPEATEIPSDTWNDDTVIEEVSLFALPAALKEAETWANTYVGPVAPDGRTAATAPDYKRLIEESIKDGTVFPFDSSTYPVGYQVWKWLGHGISTMPVTRPVITRRRTFSTTYESRNQLEFRQKVWTTSAFISEFEIPTAVQSRLPETPTEADTVSGTVWGWKLTQDSASYLLRENRIEEIRVWTFASWVESFFEVQT